jgi:hypothetical protein
MRKEIVEKFVTILSAIKTTAGYQTNLGTNVREWDNDPIFKDKLPCLLVTDMETSFLPDQRPNAHYQKLTLSLKIICTAASPMPDLRKMIADVYKCIGASENDIYALGIENFYPESDSILLDGDTMEIGGAEIRILFEFVKPRWVV